MTAPRMFYTDPLKAAWMERDYGVKLTTKGDLPLVNVGIGMASESHMGFIYHQPPYYVHPDSEHIFQPQVGDIVVFSADDGSLCVDAVEQVYFDGDESYPYTGDSGTVIQLCASHPDWLHARKARIIQRNGKAFFMPENE